MSNTILLIILIYNYYSNNNNTIDFANNKEQALPRSVGLTSGLFIPW